MNQFLKRKAKEAAQMTEKEKKTKASVEELLEIANTVEAAVVETAPEEVAEVVAAPSPEAEAVPKERKPRAKRHKAYNVFYDSATKKFMLVTIEYTIKTGYSSIVSVEPVADNWRVGMGKVHDIMALKLARGEDAE